jgi:heterodisulfide reductase subunit A2
VNAVLVIGGGVAGVQAALDLADAGARVVLVERSPSLGGTMAALDKNFPTLDCSICIEAPKLSEVAEHPHVEVLTNAEVTALDGEAGAFLATIRQKARFVSDECTRCNLCTETCPVGVASEFDHAMATRKAIYTPFPQAVPGAYTIDIERCLNDPPNYLPCGRCSDVCAPQCIDFGQPRVRELRRNVAAVIVTTGFETMPADALAEYGYGRHPDVLTAMEFERLLSAAGPSGGEIVRPSDGRQPERVLFVLCVGSRDTRQFRYCSRVCCMYSIKEAYQAVDHGVANVTVMFMDVRAYGKGFDAFWDRTRDAGVRFVRTRPAQIAPVDGELSVRYEDTRSGHVRDERFDLVVLATAIQPSAGVGRLAEALGLELDEDGFFRAVDREGGVIAATRPGVYVAGCAAGPKDIPDTVTEASAAAARALAHVGQRTWAEEPMPEPRPADEEERIGVFVCDCGSNIAGTVGVPDVVRFAQALPGVAHAEEVMFACAGNTQQAIAETIKAKGLNRLVVAACSPKTHEGTFKRVCLKAALNPYLLEMANIRNQSSWVHKADKAGATHKAEDMVRMGVEKARRLEPLERMAQPVVRAALVVGGGPAGMSAAASLARQGIETHLVEREPELGGLARQLHTLAPREIDAGGLLDGLQAEVEAAGVQVHTGTEIETIGGHVGQYTARLTSGEELQAGAVVLATGALPYTPRKGEFEYGRDQRVLTNLELEERLRQNDEAETLGADVTFVGCVGSRQGERGCSRYCCTSMIGQALRLRRQGKRVRVLAREIRTYGRQAEQLYEQAMREGVQFIRYGSDRQPGEAVDFADGVVVSYDEQLGQAVCFDTDALVLTVGLEPRGEAIFEQLKVSRSQDGFLLEKHPKLGPVEAGSPGIYLAGAAQAPKDAAESISQGLAAAGKAAALLAQDVVVKEPIVARISADPCTGCGVCVKVCPFGAIEMTTPLEGKPRGVAYSLEAACQGCGTCAATCNFDAIEMPSFTDAQILAQIDAALADDAPDKVLVFACNWCSYAGADQAGVEKLQYPPSSRVIRTMCSGRVDEKFVTRAFERGAGAVLVTGCRIGDCHYINANQQTLKRFGLWQKHASQKGIALERLQLQWVSASEGKLFANKLREMDEVVRVERPA